MMKNILTFAVLLSTVTFAQSGNMYAAFDLQKQSVALNTGVVMKYNSLQWPTGACSITVHDMGPE